MRRRILHERRKTGEEESSHSGKRYARLPVRTGGFTVTSSLTRGVLSWGWLLGFAYGGVNSLFPIAIARVTGTIFQGAAPNPMAWAPIFTRSIQVQKSIRSF